MPTFSENERGQAAAKAWLAKAYANDLIEFSAGDVNRFGRMVDGRGVSVANPAMWLGKIAGIAADPAVKHFYGDSINVLIAKLAIAGFKLSEQESQNV